MTTDPTPVGATRLCVIADLGDGELLADLDRLEELLLNLAGWEAEAAEPGGDGWTSPGPLAGDSALAALNRIQAALRPTQTRTARDEHGHPRDVPPDGPAWYAADGRYELAPLSFVPLPVADVALLGQVAAELGRPNGDPDVAELVEQMDAALPPTVNAGERERRGLVATAARVHGLLDLAPTEDTVVLHEAHHRAAGNTDRLVLTAEQEAAYHRTVSRINAMATLGDPLTRWAMGTPVQPSQHQGGRPGGWPGPP
jgi:hypothetical protein